MKVPKVFITYSHDSPEHEENVLQLAKTLRKHGVDATLDRYETRPSEGWPLWCQKQLEPTASDYVLVICTATYLNRLEKRVPSYEGKGSYWEGSLILQCIYDEKQNRRFIPVLLPGSNEQDIPFPLRAYTRYPLDNYSLESPGYQALYRELTGQPEVIKPELGALVNLPPKRTVPLVLAPALAEREVKTDFQTGTINLPPTGPSFPPTKGPQALRWLRRAVFSAVGLSLLTALLWWLCLDRPVKLAVSRHSARALQYAFLQVRGAPGMTKLAARIASIMRWQQQDFQDDPLSILDVLNRGKLVWTNKTTGLGTSVSIIFPLTNHYTLLTSLSQPPEGWKVDWMLTDNSDDPAVTALLLNAQSLKDSIQLAPQDARLTALTIPCWLPLSRMLSDPKRLAAGVPEDAPATPTSKEFSVFASDALEVLRHAESLHILSAFRSGTRWLFVCQMGASNSTAPMLVLFHSRWKPTNCLQINRAGLTPLKPEEWESEYSIIMPPTAWDESRAWVWVR